MKCSNDSNETYFSTRFKFNKKRTMVWKEIARYIRRHTVGEDSILELGAGYGDFINQVDFKEKIAIDINEQSNQYVNDGVMFYESSCTDLSFLKESSIENVFASNLLEHLNRSQIDQTIDEIKRVLKTNGRLLIIQPNFRLCYANYFDDYTHVSVFSDVSMCDYLESRGLKIIQHTPGLLPFSFKSRIPTNRLLVRAYLNLPFRPFAKQMYIVAEKVN